MSLIASYRFNKGSLLDYSGNGHHGILTPGVGGFRNSNPMGMLFDGLLTKIDCGSDFIGTSALTISCWIYLETNGESTAPQILNNGKMLFGVDGTASQYYYFQSDAVIFKTSKV